MSNFHKFISKNYFIPWIFNIILVLFYVSGMDFKALLSSAVDYKNVNVEPFDGTVMPLQTVPNYFWYKELWKNNLTFAEIDSKKFIQIPKYEPTKLAKNFTELGYASDEYNETVTLRSTYITPYMWAYTHTWKEYVGSHLAVDIKAATWTPVRSIANWVVYAVKNNPYWFGKFVVVKHPNIPYKWEETDLYSGYAHLNSQFVKPWNAVLKGQILGEVGNTWISTTPHLHFQIDTKDAPFKMYWPFSSAESKKANLSFFESINEGLWKENAIKYTIHPMDFIYDNKDIWSVLVKNDEEEIIDNREEVVDTIDDNSETQIDEEVIEEPKKDEPKEEEKNITITKKAIVDSDVEVVNILWWEVAWEVITLAWNDSLIATINNDFDDLLLFDKKTISKEIWEVASSDDEVTRKLLWDVIKDVTADTIEDTSDDSFNSFSDLSKDDKYYQAVNFLKNKNLIDGYSDNTFKWENYITRWEVSKMFVKWFSLSVSENTKNFFVDIPSDSWQKKYINKLVDLDIISTTKNHYNPFDNITRIEWLKIALKLNNINLSNYKLSDWELSDVNPNEWFAPYIKYSIDNNLLSYSWKEFNPNSFLTRWEIVYIIYNIIK